MEFERAQFSDDLLDDNFTPDVEPADEGFQRLSDLGDEPKENEGDDPQEPAEEPEEPVSEEPAEEPEEVLSVMEQYLKSKGVRDGKTIVYEDDETGETTEVDFASLNPEEQLQILNDLSASDLSSDEQYAIDYLRRNNATLQDVITYFQDQAVQEYIKNNSTNAPSTVDNFDDETLYLADLKSRFPEMSDEELTTELELAQSNEDLFKKKVDAIRANYKAEEEKQAKAAIEEEQKRQEAYQKDFTDHLDQFTYVLMDHTDPKSDKFVVEDRDRQAIYDYIFKKTPEGVSQLVMDMNDMDALIQLAWLRLYGQDAITDTTRYWKQELKKQRRAENNPTTKPAHKTVVVPKKQETKQETSLGSAWDKYL